MFHALFVPVFGSMGVVTLKPINILGGSGCIVFISMSAVAVARGIM